MLKENKNRTNRNLKLIFQICCLTIALMAVNKSSIFAQEMHAENIMPAYPGGIDALKTTIEQNLKYPAEALKAGISGIVLVNFIIDAEGEMQNVKVMQGLSPECDAESKRVVSLLKGWSPGVRQGKPVNISVSLPIQFKSDKKVSPQSVSGIITEKTTGKVIEGAFVIVKGTNVGSVTNGTGSFRLDLPSESKDLIIFAVGYASTEVSIDFHSTINIELESEHYLMDIYSVQK